MKSLRIGLGMGLAFVTFLTSTFEIEHNPTLHLFDQIQGFPMRSGWTVVANCAHQR